MSDVLEELTRALADRYTIERELGSGGMATVYLAEDLRHERKVAIKVLRPELSATLGADRFLREIKIAAKLNHPHILPLLDSGIAKERLSDGPPNRPSAFLYYVMPYVEGESLRDRLNREHQLPLEEAVRITREVAAALVHAHEHGVIHRDIKPANILLSGGEAVVADFGIARAVSAAGGDDLTETGTAVGTPAYMSPEQATAQDVDGRSDIYSLACVLYEMVGGDPPFTATTPTAILARKLSDPVPSLKVVRKTVPDELEHVVKKALEQIPADRYSTAAEFLDALADPTAAVAPSTTHTHARWNLQSASVVVGIVAVSAVIVALSRWLILPIRGGTGAIERIAVMPCANRTNDPNQEPIVLGLHDEIIAGLGRVAGVSVRGSRSVTRYAESDMTVPEIAEALGIQGLVECSVFMVADSVRVSASLRDGQRDEQLWSDSFARGPGRVFDLAAAVVRGISESLDADYAPADGTQFAARLTSNSEAYSHYQQGRFLQKRLTEDELRRAIEHFDEAIGHDSSFAAAYSAKAEAIMWMGDVVAVTAGTSPIEWMPEARHLVERALEIDENLADAHRVLGYIRWSHDYDYEGGLEEARLATELAPDDPMNWDWFAQALSVLGPDFDDEAIAAARRAVELDPAEAMHWSDLSATCYPAQAFEEALTAARTAIELDPRLSIAYANMAVTLTEMGRHEAAFEWYAQAQELSPHPVYLGILGAGNAFTGNRQEAERILGELLDMAGQRYVGPRAFTLLYFSLGRYDDAIASMIRSAELRDPGANLWDIRSTIYAPLHDHPRYPAVLRAMKLER